MSRDQIGQYHSILKSCQSDRLHCVSPDNLQEGSLEWVLRSDAMLEPNEPVGLGGHLYNQWWTFQTNSNISIPMAEFIAAAFGIIIFGETLGSCSTVTLEIDALSVGFILKDEHAASPGMKAILAELLDLPQFQALTSRADRLHTRHAGGEGNPSGMALD